MNKWRLLKILNMLVLVKDRTSKDITFVPLAIHPLKKKMKKKKLLFGWFTGRGSYGTFRASYT